jgi:hypothetical protein
MSRKGYVLVSVSAWQVKEVEVLVGDRQVISICTWSFSPTRYSDWTVKICTQFLPSLLGKRLWALKCPFPPWEGQCRSKFRLAPRLVVKFG